MIVVAICSLLALLFTYLESRGRLRGGMKMGFVLVTVLGVIHYDYGNDYMAYYDIYRSIVGEPFNWANVLSGNTYKEPGWALINYMFQPIGGFFVMVAVLNIIQNVIYYKFIRNNVESSWWPMAVFIYLFSTSFYLLNFSMMRQGLAVAIFIGLWDYIKRKKWFYALCGLLCACSIHSSALILLPFAFWGYFSFRNGKLTALLFLILFIALWSSQDLLNEIFSSVLFVEEIQQYANSYGKREIEVSYGLGFIIGLIPLCISMYYFLFNRGTDKLKRSIVALASIGYLVVPFTQIIPLVDRFAIYFNAFGISSICVAYSSIRSKKLRYILLSIYILIMIYDYWRFFNVGVYSAHYLEFKSLFALLYDRWQIAI